MIHDLYVAVVLAFITTTPLWATALVAMLANRKATS